MSAQSFSTCARGKLLLTGEYFVLDGAQALAMPVRYGQTLDVYSSSVTHLLTWSSRNPDGSAWFEGIFELPSLKVIRTSDSKTADTLSDILRAFRAQNPALLSGDTGFSIETRNDFPREWGLGTSSTLIAALARWAEADPYKVLNATLGGSGYDLACAYANGPILYRLEDKVPEVSEAIFSPAFSANLGFVYLGKKQNSREGIARYRALGEKAQQHIAIISDFTRQMLEASELNDFMEVMLKHEQLVARILGLPRARDLYFSDFPGEIKSLGAWGGDFVLVAGKEPFEGLKPWFRQKGFNTCIAWADMF
jgi:mevalonate kinase